MRIRLTFAPVKFITLLFAFYILFLSTAPWCAADNCSNENRQTEFGGKHEHKDDCTNCSPFNLCGNCVGFTIPTRFYQVVTIKQVTKQAFEDYTQLYFPNYIPTPWQPPKIN